MRYGDQDKNEKNAGRKPGQHDTLDQAIRRIRVKQLLIQKRKKAAANAAQSNNEFQTAAVIFDNACGKSVTNVKGRQELHWATRGE
jgi:hypothetical protein